MSHECQFTSSLTIVTLLAFCRIIDMLPNKWQFMHEIIIIVWLLCYHTNDTNYRINDNCRMTENTRTIDSFSHHQQFNVCFDYCRTIYILSNIVFCRTSHKLLIWFHNKKKSGENRLICSTAYLLSYSVQYKFDVQRKFRLVSNMQLHTYWNLLLNGHLTVQHKMNPSMHIYVDLQWILCCIVHICLVTGNDNINITGNINCYRKIQNESLNIHLRIPTMNIT